MNDTPFSILIRLARRGKWCKQSRARKKIVLLVFAVVIIIFFSCFLISNRKWNVTLCTHNYFQLLCATLALFFLSAAMCSQVRWKHFDGVKKAKEKLYERLRLHTAYLPTVYSELKRLREKEWVFFSLCRLHYYIIHVIYVYIVLRIHAT